jgi:glucosylceramidase
MKYIFLLYLFLFHIFLLANNIERESELLVYETAKDTDALLTHTQTLKFEENVPIKESLAAIFIDPTKSFQTIVGFGGALTDASAETFYKLPEEKQKEFINAYYSQEQGIGYSLGRTNINSCDFSTESYTYVEENDTALSTFNIAVDKRYKIPFIKEAIAKAGKLAFYVSPWSPPAWMKTNNNMLKGGELKEEYAASWANYYVRFIHEYEKEGIPIWGVTIQNEPASIQRWESCIYTAEQERDFIKHHLGPAMHKAGFADKKIIAWDHNRGLMFHRAATIYNDPDAAKYVWGIGIHWYTGNHFENVTVTKEAFPDKEIIFTEGCVEAFREARLNDWKLGERYGRSIINDLNGGVVAWTDWNILLDEKGGPNHVENYCLAPIHGNTVTGELIYTNSYYYIGHFSKFIRPGAKRISSSKTSDALLATAFMNEDKSIVVVVQNPTEKEYPFDIWLNNKAARTTVKANSIYSFVIRNAETEKAQQKYSNHYYKRLKDFAAEEPVKQTDIVFMGNSITEGAKNWNALLGIKNARNRGISGDTSEGMIDRIYEILPNKPSKIFILIGVNDISRGIHQDTVISNILKLTREVKRLSPETQVFLQSILPVNKTLNTYKTLNDNLVKKIKYINKNLEKTAKKEQAVFLNLYPEFVYPKTDTLKKEFTTDGLHLNNAGYENWASILKKHI